MCSAHEPVRPQNSKATFKLAQSWVEVFIRKTEDSHLFHTFYMIIDLAAKQPFTIILGHHKSIHKSSWEKADCVNTMLPFCQYLPVKKNGVDISFIANAKKIPFHFLFCTHCDIGKIPIHISIDCFKRERGREISLILILTNL